eukprot:gene12021-5420_t
MKLANIFFLICIFASLTIKADERVKVESSDDVQIKISTPLLGVYIKLEDDAPYFTVRNKNNSKVFKIKFDQLYQVHNVSNPNAVISNSNIPLASLKWKLQQHKVVGNRLDFNITATSSTGISLQFRNHIYPTLQDFKFDVVIDKFNNSWKPSGNFLALAFQLREEDKEDGRGERNADGKEIKEGGRREKIAFGGGYFRIVPDFATSSGLKTCQVVYSKFGEKRRAVILYPKFGDWMNHDPSFGVTSSAATNFLSVSVFLVVFLFSLF